MAINDFQTFASAGGANVLSQADYLNLAAKASGFQSGIASSAQLNKIWRQASIMSSMIGQFICDEANANAVDDGTTSRLEADFVRALQAVNLVKLTGILNLYINPSTGNDVNTGLDPSVAFKTMQAAINAAIVGYNFSNNQLNINLAPGTYPVGVSIYNMPLGCPQINIIGGASQSEATSYQITVTNGNGIVCNGVVCKISGVKITASGNSSANQGNGVVCNQSSIILQNCVFASCGASQVVGTISYVTIITCTFTGTSPYGIVASVSAFVSLVGTTITYSSAVYSVTNAYSNFGYLYAVAATITGTATGKRWIAGNNGIISTNGAGVNLFPGTVAGTFDTGGQYN